MSAWSRPNFTRSQRVRIIDGTIRAVKVAEGRCLRKYLDDRNEEISKGSRRSFSSEL